MESDRGYKDEGMLLLHFFNESFLGYFLTRATFFGGGSQLGFVGGVEENLAKVSVYQAVAWADRMKGPKLISCCYFLLLCCSSESFLEAFSTIEVFSGDGFCMSFLPNYEEKRLWSGKRLSGLAIGTATR